MPNYSLGKVYKLVSNQTDQVYYGSTCSPLLSTRLAGHGKHYRLYLKDKYHYMTSFELIKYDDVQIILVEKVDCKSRDELRARERFYIENYDCVNKTTPGKTQKERNQEYEITEKCKTIRKTYRDSRKDEITNCDCGGFYRYGHKSQHEKTKMHQDPLYYIR